MNTPHLKQPYFPSKVPISHPSSENPKDHMPSTPFLTPVISRCIQSTATPSLRCNHPCLNMHHHMTPPSHHQITTVSTAHFLTPLLDLKAHHRPQLLGSALPPLLASPLHTCCMMYALTTTTVLTFRSTHTYPPPLWRLASPRYTQPLSIWIVSLALSVFTS